MLNKQEVEVGLLETDNRGQRLLGVGTERGREHDPDDNQTNVQEAQR